MNKLAALAVKAQLRGDLKLCVAVWVRRAEKV